MVLSTTVHLAMLFDLTGRVEEIVAIRQCFMTLFVTLLALSTCGVYVRDVQFVFKFC